MSGFDVFADVNTFTLKSMDVYAFIRTRLCLDFDTNLPCSVSRYRMHVWRKMAQ